jgi:hypothetical protein
MAEGYSYTACAGLFGVWFQTLYDWEKRYPEWVKAKAIGTAKAQLFWEKLCLDNMLTEFRGPTFNTTAWIFNMKNRFQWRDRVEVEEKNDGQTQVQRLIINLEGKKEEPDDSQS